MENKADNTINYNNIFNGGEFVLTQDSNGEFVGGGYKIISSFLQGGQPIMTTLNDKEQDGGNVSSPFENLAVPAGLFYINTKISKNENFNEHFNDRKTAPDDMIDKLYALVEYDKKRKRKTKKHNIKKNKKNTRKHK
jgi:hypothetical protein